MGKAILSGELKPATGLKDQSLVLTPLQDLKGFLTHHLGRFLLFLITCSSVLAVFLIFFFVIRESVPFIKNHDLVEFLASKKWYPEADVPKFGALSIIVGSFYVTFVSLIFAVPVGILAAVFLSDIVSFKIGQFVKPIIEILAAIPSVAYGFFAVLVLAPWWLMAFSRFWFWPPGYRINSALQLVPMP
jgi:phosphate transport system permease protein